MPCTTTRSSHHPLAALFALSNSLACWLAGWFSSPHHRPPSPRPFAWVPCWRLLAAALLRAACPAVPASLLLRLRLRPPEVEKNTVYFLKYSRNCKQYIDERKVEEAMYSYYYYYYDKQKLLPWRRMQPSFMITQVVQPGRSRQRGRGGRSAAQSATMAMHSYWLCVLVAPASS